MKTPTTPVRLDTPLGPLYVAVDTATRHSYYDSERGDVTELRPELRVASDPEFTADPNHTDHWTIRKSAHGVHYVIFFEDRTRFEGGRWHRDGYTPYQGGFVNNMRKPVGFMSKTWDLMWQTLTEALDRFDVDHPRWQDLSRYLLLRSEQTRHEARAADLRREAEEHDAKAIAFAAEAAAVGNTLPDGLFDLINKEHGS
jgi:hypothetical protein